MSQDHKKVGKATRLNTGGMGAYAPTRLVTPEMLAEYEESIVRPTLAGLKAEGIEFRGTLYVGLMLTNAGPKVLEFNVRFGDPETQVILPLLDDDLVPLLLASARGKELPDSVRFKDAYAMVVVLASAGYPESYPKGEVISTLPISPRAPNSFMRARSSTRREMRNRRGSGPGCGGHGLEPAGSKGKSECSVRFSRFPFEIFPQGHRTSRIFKGLNRFYLAFLQKEDEKNQRMGKKSRAKKERKQEKLVVFICTANVCRSPMAEKLFEEAVAKSGTKKKIRVFSAGISAMDGDRLPKTPSSPPRRWAWTFPITGVRPSPGP